MTGRTAWQKAFRTGHGPRAVEVLAATWHAMVARVPDSFHPRRKEPELTEMLCFHLEEIRAQHRLPGRWSNELPQGRLHEEQTRAEVRDRKRTDINYFTERDDPATNLTFEFKKLDEHSTSREKYVKDGMVRFISGEYSKGEPAALMVGILTMHSDDVVPPLLRRLNDADSRVLLGMGKLPIARPSNLFECAHCDTEHLRPAEKAPPHGTIVISHVFLGFPDLPRAKARRARRAAVQADLDG